MNLVGLDLSLTATGVASRLGVTTLKPGALRGMERLAWIRQRVELAVKGLDPQDWADLVAIEGYAFGRPNQASHLGELGGVIRMYLHEQAVPFVDIPPKSLKLYATGRGNAGKPEMLGAAIRRLDFGGSDDNEVDALWLRAMALDHYGAPLCEMPEKNRGAIAKIEWPVLA